MYMYKVITVQVLGDMLYYTVNYNYNYNYKYYNRTLQHSLEYLLYKYVYIPTFIPFAIALLICALNNAFLDLLYLLDIKFAIDEREAPVGLCAALIASTIIAKNDGDDIINLVLIENLIK